MTDPVMISKPSGGWLHSDKLISKHGATYTVKYVGCLEVVASMKMLDYSTRSSVARECIYRVCETAGIKAANKKRKVDKNVQRAITDVPNMENTGICVSLNISSSSLSLTSIENHHIVSSHDMPRISFASGGDSDTQDFVAYIAKDLSELRACYVLECTGVAKDIITTIGQAFELRYKQYCKPTQMALAMNQMMVPTGGDADKDYYNDLPGKVPPDMGPPPVPPLPIIVPPLTTLPPVQSPNLIDLNSDLSPHHDLPHHNYVNDVFSRERDVFDMQPFATHTHVTSVICRKASEINHLADLQHEIWFHGKISRAEAERFLQKDGDFLVRESPNSENKFVLSGMQNNTKKHLLLIDPEGIVRTKDNMFNSVSHLINFHCENALPIISAESALVLRTPIPRAA